MGKRKHPLTLEATVQVFNTRVELLIDRAIRALPHYVGIPMARTALRLALQRARGQFASKVDYDLPVLAIMSMMPNHCGIVLHAKVMNEKGTYIPSLSIECKVDATMSKILLDKVHFFYVEYKSKRYNGYRDHTRSSSTNRMCRGEGDMVDNQLLGSGYTVMDFS